MNEPLQWQQMATEDREQGLRPWRLEVWVRRYTAMVYSLGLRMTGDAGWAEELTQDVFLELDRNQARMQNEEHLRRWLRQVTVHRAVDGLRQRNRREPGWQAGKWVSLTETEVAETGLGETGLGGTGMGGTGLTGTGLGGGQLEIRLNTRLETRLATRMAAQVESWLLQLPVRQREALLLRYQESMTPEEIAATLAAPVATVKSHLQRGLKTLRQLADSGKE